MSQTSPLGMLLAGTRPKALPRTTPKAVARSNEETVRITTRNLTVAGVLPIVHRVAGRWGVSAPHLLGTARGKHVSAARRELWALLYGSLQPISYPELGYLVCRDHSTMMTALEKREREVAEGRVP